MKRWGFIFVLSVFLLVFAVAEENSGVNNAEELVQTYVFDDGGSDIVAGNGSVNVNETTPIRDNRINRTRVRQAVRVGATMIKEEYRAEIEGLKEEYKGDREALMREAKDLLDGLDRSNMTNIEKAEIREELLRLRGENRELKGEYRNEAKGVRVEYRGELKSYLQDVSKRYKMRNGREVEVKIMPDVASERAIERLGLKNCNEENNCTIEFKEVGKGNETRLAYSLRADKPGRFFGMFRVKMMVEGEVDSESGDVIRTRKPWWAILVNE